MLYIVRSVLSAQLLMGFRHARTGKTGFFVLIDVVSRGAIAPPTYLVEIRKARENWCSAVVCLFALVPAFWSVLRTNGLSLIKTGRSLKSHLVSTIAFVGICWNSSD